MVKAFVATGNVEEVLQQIEPFWKLADSLCPTPPVWGLSPEKLQFYGKGVADVVTAVKR